LTITGQLSQSPSFELNVSVDAGPKQNIPLQEVSQNTLKFMSNLQRTSNIEKKQELNNPPASEQGPAIP